MDDYGYEGLERSVFIQVSSSSLFYQKQTVGLVDRSSDQGAVCVIAIRGIDPQFSLVFDRAENDSIKRN